MTIANRSTNNHTVIVFPLWFFNAVHIGDIRLDPQFFQFRSQVGRQSRAFVRPLLRKELMFSRITPSFTPESRGKEHQQCKDLETTKQHVGNQDPFSHRVHTGKVISNHAKPWPQVIQCCNNRGKGRKVIHARGDNRQHTDNKHQCIGGEKSPNGFEDTFRQCAIPQLML